MHEAYEEQSIRMRTEKDRKVERNFPTLRDQFAMSTLSGLEANSSSELIRMTPEEIAEYCYKVADAFMKARKDKMF